MPKNEKPRSIDQKRASSRGYTFVSGNGGGGGVTDHGWLTGLLDDDHPQYLDTTRGDLRYVPTTRQVTGVNGLTGGGALSGDLALSVATGLAGNGLDWQSTGVLKVGAGDGIGVAADTVGVDATVARATWPVIAGLGLTDGGNLAAAGVTLNVGVAGLGLSLEANAVRLTSSSNPGAAASVLASDAGGKLRLRDIEVGTQGATTPAVTISGADNAAAGPDILISGNGLLAAQTNLYLAIDSNNTTTTSALVIGNNAPHSGFNELARFTESGRLGIGNASPAYELDVTGTAQATVALRTATAYATTKVQTTLIDTAAGNISITPAGDIVLDPGGSDVLPGGSVEDDLGDYNRKWRTLFASELYVETLVAQDVLSTIGGRIEVTPTTALIADLDNLDSTMDVKHNNLRSGEYAYLMTAPAGVAKFEAIKVVSGASAITGGYRYSITRNLDGSGANDFYAGDAVASLGKNVGEGHISLTATSTVYNHLGPTIAIYARNSTAAWNALTPTTAMGNLESFVGYGTPTQGFAVGNDLTKEPTTGFIGLTADATNGVRLFNTPFAMYNGATETVHIGAWNDVWLGPSSSDKRLAWDGTDLAVGSWTINNASIVNSNIRLYAGTTTTARIELGSASASTDTQVAVAGIRGGDGSTLSGVAFWAGRPHAYRTNAPFRVTVGGSLTSTDATITAGGSGVKDSTLNGWCIDPTEIVGQTSGVDQVVLNTAGNIYAGGGGVGLTRQGVVLKTGDNSPSYTWPFNYGGVHVVDTLPTTGWRTSLMFSEPALIITGARPRSWVFRYNCDLNQANPGSGWWSYADKALMIEDAAAHVWKVYHEGNLTIGDYAPLASPAFSGTPKVGANTIWHAGNDGSGSGLDADYLDTHDSSYFATAAHNHDSTYAALAGATFAGGVTFNGTVILANAVQLTSGVIRLTPVSSAPGYQSGYGFLYLEDASGHGKLRFKWRSGDGTTFNDVAIATI